MVEFINPYVFTQSLQIQTNQLKIYNMSTGELIREKRLGYIFNIQVDQKFLSVGHEENEDKVSVFDLEEMTNKKIENNHLWQRDFVYKSMFSCLGTTKSKMLIARGKVVKIFDFWPDRDLEVTEDIDSDESEDEDESYSEASNDIDWDSLNEESFDEDYEED